MPIRINLLAEDQAAEEMRRRDPVKRALWAAGVFVTLVLCGSGWLQVQVGSAAHDLGKYEAQWVKLEQGCKRVTDNLQQTADIERKLTALHQLAANRFLWGPPLNALQNVVMENVQITRFKSSQSYILTPEIKPTERDGKAIPGKAPTSTEKIGLTIEAKDFSNPAGSQVNQYKQALTAFGYFNEQLKKVDGARLTELSAPQSDPNDTARSFVLFTLSCVYPEKLRSNKHE